MLADFLDKSKALQSLEKNFTSNFSFLLENIFEAPKAFFSYFVQEKTKKNLLIISGGTKENDFIENLSYLSQNVLEFPSWETLPEENILPSPDVIGARFSILEKLSSLPEKKIVLAPLQAVLQKTISKNSLSKKLLTWKKGDKIAFYSLEKTLLDLDYKRVSVVADKGEFALRGGILDVFSPADICPYRIEFVDDTIESLRKFDHISQKTIEKTDKAFICPVKELTFSDEATLEESSFLLDYLSPDTVIVFDDLLSIEDVALTLKKMLQHKSNYLISLEEFFEKIKNYPKIFFTKENIEKLFETKITHREKFSQDISFDLANLKIETKRFAHPFFDLFDFFNMQALPTEEIAEIKQLYEAKIPTIFLTENPKEEDFIKQLLKNQNIPLPSFFSFKKGYLSSSFIISDIPLAYIPYSEFSHKKKIRRQKYRSTYHTPAAEFHHLKEGDIVVHFHSGIGKYLGIEKHKNHLGKEDDFLIVEYENNSKLFVPISQAYLVSKYIGAREEAPLLSTLGSTKWQKTKLLAQKQIVGYASDLLNLYAERSQESRETCPEDSEDLKLFEMEFPYEETPDQMAAIEAIKKDMQEKKPMERLICGDVGYGKTEVAMRAAFKAVVDGKKQVALLVPTTVLAMQHFESFQQRMQTFPIIIELVSRFNPPKKNKEILEKVKLGQVDILIGTHRIISKDVSFKNLGLIIIDEEQRFGVRAKEHLKKLKKSADSLSLSATPIPRSLYMSLINVRNMSLINTPPQDRLPIKTIIATNEDNIIQNALLREMSREGQSFFIHNRVESIYKRAAHLQTLVPHAKILIVHGQMSADETDAVFHVFKKGEADLLVTTTIVENGIDIPNANTILIDNADTFGLADLYQLRGRVGRWNKTAYAYLLVAKNKRPSEIAQKRLSALLEAGSYGGGMKIAMRDLEIRGAGDVLGVKQSGQISALGFHLYCKLLKRALFALKNQKPVNFAETKIEFSIPAFIPEYYISETNLRMEIYHRLGEASSDQEIDDIAEEMQDRFGKMPTEALFLLNFAKIRIFANTNKFTSLKFGNLTFTAKKQTGKKELQKTIVLPKTLQSSADSFKNYVIEQLTTIF